MTSQTPGQISYPSLLAALKDEQAPSLEEYTGERFAIGFGEITESDGTRVQVLELPDLNAPLPEVDAGQRFLNAGPDAYVQNSKLGSIRKIEKVIDANGRISVTACFVEGSC